MINFIPKPEQVYRRRLNRLTSHRILGHLEFDSISDIHLFFKNLQVEEMVDLFSPLDFSAINGYPHASLDKALEKLPTFQGNDVVTTKPMLKPFLCALINGVML